MEDYALYEEVTCEEFYQENYDDLMESIAIDEINFVLNEFVLDADV